MKMKVKLMYPKLFAPDTKYAPKWKADCLLDKEGLEVAKKAELRIKFNPKYVGLYEGYDGHFICPERYTHTKAGKPIESPPVKDSTLKDVPSSVAIGNGTDAYVQFTIKSKISESDKKRWGGYGMFLKGVQILNLVEHAGFKEANPDEDFVTEAGSYSFEEVEGESPF